jgi:hypothetical protein
MTMSGEDWLSDEERADLESSRRAVDEAERKAFWESHWEARESRKPNGEAGKGGTQKPKMSIEWFAEAADSALSDPGNQLIEGVLDEGGLSVNYGDSGSGKTFVALDMGFHVGAGLDWNGKKVRRGLVVYVAAEGGKRIKRRIAALRKRYREDHGDVAPDPLFALVRYQIDLRSSDADLKSLLALVREGREKDRRKMRVAYRRHPLESHGRRRRKFTRRHGPHRSGGR